MSDEREQEQRFVAVVGEEERPHAEQVEMWWRHLESHLTLPCAVTGIEDFRWEEFYVLGPGSADEYEMLREEQPSYKDVFELTAIESETDSQWAMFQDDLMAQVRRPADGKRFVLGLSELEAVDRMSVNHRLLDDFAVWFVNSR